VDRIVDHLDALLSQSAQRSTEAGKPIGNAGVVLDVAVSSDKENISRL
jgi:hypothetical protein